MISQELKYQIYDWQEAYWQDEQTSMDERAAYEQKAINKFIAKADRFLANHLRRNRRGPMQIGCYSYRSQMKATMTKWADERNLDVECVDWCFCITPRKNK